MACNQTLAGIARDCANSIGGVAEVYLANKEDVTAITETADVVTAITMASSAKFKKYSFKSQTAEVVSTLNKSLENGSAYVGTDLTMQFHKQDTAKRLEIMAIAVGDLVAIYKDNNGKYFLMGADRAVEATAGTGNSGKAFGDFNGYAITLHADEASYPVEVNEDVIATIL